MKIGIIGAGRVGGTLGSRWARSGYQVIFGVRNPNSEKAQTLLSSAGQNASAVNVAEAAAAADVVVFATPWDATQEAIRAAGNLTGKVVVDCTNPGRSDMKGLAIGLTTSGGEQVAAWAKGARVVKAFNTVFSTVMADPTFGSQQATAFVAGDDAEAKSIVTELGKVLGFEMVDTGPLSNARFLEPMAFLIIQVAFGTGVGPNVAFKLMKR
jgi:8-hydroxy-5-deazaflavin:NADPH oxidoreductase